MGLLKDLRTVLVGTTVGVASQLVAFPIAGTVMAAKRLSGSSAEEAKESASKVMKVAEDATIWSAENADDILATVSLLRLLGVPIPPTGKDD